MATATSEHGKSVARRALWPVVAALVVVVLSAWIVHAHRSSDAAAPTAFGWLRPAVTPPGWNVSRTSAGATLRYPPGWHRIRTDPGSASAAPAGPHGPFEGYLNATPQSGDETLANWSRFRIAHLADEGAHDVRLAAAATHLSFRKGRGSCVVDSYATDRLRFREIACIVAGPRGTTVIVAAAPSRRWTTQAAVLRHAVASFTT